MFQELWKNGGCSSFGHNCSSYPQIKLKLPCPAQPCPRLWSLERQIFLTLEELWQTSRSSSRKLTYWLISFLVQNHNFRICEGFRIRSKLDGFLHQKVFDLMEEGSTKCYLTHLGPSCPIFCGHLFWGQWRDSFCWANPFPVQARDYGDDLCHRSALLWWVASSCCPAGHWDAPKRPNQKVYIIMWLFFTYILAPW